MNRTCVAQFRKDGLDFIPGLEYKVDFNPIDKNLYIYTVWGYTTISTSQLNRYFV